MLIPVNGWLQPGSAGIDSKQHPALLCILLKHDLQTVLYNIFNNYQLTLESDQ